MKYVMFETAEGGKFPVIFPDQIAHVFMNAAVRAITGIGLETPWEPVSAGFINIGNCDVHGESESLGGLAHNEADAARIIIGDSVAFMPDLVAVNTLRMYEENKSG